MQASFSIFQLFHYSTSLQKTFLENAIERWREMLRCPFSSVSTFSIQVQLLLTFLQSIPQLLVLSSCKSHTKDLIMGDGLNQQSRGPNKQNAIQGTEKHIVPREDNLLHHRCGSNPSTSNSNSGSHSSSNGFATSSKGENHWDLPPPPAESFQTYELAKSSVHEWARRHGYDFSVKKVCKNKEGKIHRRILACTRGGKLDNKRKLTDEIRIRKTRTSRKGGCEVQIWLAADDVNEPDGPWSVRHARGTRSTQHNHPGAREVDFPGHRQRAQKKGNVDDLIRQHQESRIKPQQSLAIIRQQFPGLPIVLSDVLNTRARQRREFIGTHAPAEPVP